MDKHQQWTNSGAIANNAPDEGAAGQRSRSIPEYSAGHGLVDYALLDRGSPQVFLEAKRIGAMDAGGEEQLLDMRPTGASHCLS